MIRSLVLFIVLMMTGVFIGGFFGTRENILNIVAASMAYLIVIGCLTMVLNRPFRFVNGGILVIVSLFVLTLGALLYIEPLDAIKKMTVLIVAMIVMLANLSILLWLGYTEDAEMKQKQYEHLDLVNELQELSLQCQMLKYQMDLETLKQCKEKMLKV